MGIGIKMACGIGQRKAIGMKRVYGVGLVRGPIHFRDRPDTPYIIIEVKKPKLQDGKDQLRSYCNATGAPIAVWTNGQQISHYHRKDPNYFEEITDIPNADQTLADILNERFTLKDLIIKENWQRSRNP